LVEPMGRAWQKHTGRRGRSKFAKSIQPNRKTQTPKTQKTNPMKKTILAKYLAVALAAGLTSFAGTAKASLVFTPLEVGSYPGALITDIYGLSGGAIYGSYYKDGWHPYVNKQGTFTSLPDVPGGGFTDIVGISGSSIIASSWSPSDDIGFYSFNNNTYSKLNLPTGANVQGVNGTTLYGTIFNGGYSSSQGFTYDINNGTTTTLNAPNSVYTYVDAVHGSSIALTGVESNHNARYSIINNTISPISLPSSVIYPQITAITDSGVLYGNGYDSDWNYGGFMLDNGIITSLGDKIIKSLDGDTILAYSYDYNTYTQSYFTATIPTGDATAAVPEPSQVAASLLLVAGIAGFVIVKRRKEASELEALAA